MRGGIKENDMGALVEKRTFQEHIFVLLMLALAFLYRENPILVYPEVLSCLFALLAYNLFQHWFLQRAKDPLLFHAFSVVVNSLLVGAVVYFSGGPNSSFWVLLLMPLFSSMVMHDKHVIILTLSLVLTILATFYSHLAWAALEGLPVPEEDMVQLGSKAGVLILAWVVTRNLARAEQVAKVQLEEQRDSLRELQKEVEVTNVQADKMVSLGHLTSSIAHDLNGPVAVILGYCDLLSADLPPESKTAKDVERIRDAANFCRGLVNNILSLARREDYNLTPTSMDDVFTKTWRLCEAQFRKQQVSLVKEFEPGLPDAPMSPVHIQQVLLNLLTNAAHASGAGSTVRVRAKRARNEAGRPILLFQVADQGPGIPEGLEKKLFEPFFTTKEKGKGTGLGLNISKQIIERHQGTIHAENGAGGGALFTVTLPASNSQVPA